MENDEIPYSQNNTDTYESRYLALKKEFKEFIETTRRTEELKRKEIQSDQAKKLLVLADSLCRMITAASKFSCVPGSHSDETTYLQNIEAMYQQLISIGGLIPIDPVPGTPFNDTIHLAVGLEYGSRYPENTVFSVIRKGYTREQILIRPAEVIISRYSRQDGSIKQPGRFIRFIHKFSPPRLTIEFFNHQMDILEHERSVTTHKLEEEIRTLKETLSGYTHDREELEQILSEQEKTIERFEDEIDQMKRSLSSYNSWLNALEKVQDTPDSNLPAPFFQEED